MVSNERIKMLDITRDKPIKLVVKVLVPVKDHPKFNFVGKLLGPKGNSMKRLQEETMCKMAVLGRGSMRDRKKEDELRASEEPRYSHLGEDLHVEISTFAAPAEAYARIAYALAEVRRFLVPDYHDDIRQEQMWEMHVLSNTSSSNQTEEQNSPNSMTDSEKKLIHDSCTSTRSDDIHTTVSTPSTSTVSSTTTIPTATNFANVASTLHPPLTAVVHHHQLAMNGIELMKSTSGSTSLTVPQGSETTVPTLALLEPSVALIHQPLRAMKTVNSAATSLARKRPLLGVSQSGMNPTKRTVMSLLARVKNSQAVRS